eukprot:Nitzschia sp. Nitz4//scaffold212_size37733//1873//3071//NITZ4_007728-RA/size37733-augustus-gene-0.5-mRNA-1//1//CDS//3329542007//4254//frame0
MTLAWSSMQGSTLVSTGLKNLGNTCYMNAQLQCAFHIPLVRKIVSNIEETTVPKSQVSEAKLALRELFEEMTIAAENPPPKGGIARPARFVQRLGIPPQVQQDSQEFWKLLLPAVDDEKLSDLYKGCFDDYIVALDGSGRARHREELFLDISLDVSKCSTLKSSIEQSFGKPETLKVSEGNGWRPEKGADKVDAHKGSSLLAKGLPPILQFHLKRFTYDWQTEQMKKLNDKIEFPTELDLSDAVKSDGATSPNDQLLIYDLQSIVVHKGLFETGHYYSYVRPDLNQNRWFRFNDDIVSEVSLAEVMGDSFGGRMNKDDSQNTSRGAVWSRLFQRCKNSLHRCQPFGYGGESANAYVLQYVKRSEIPKLYPKDA